jgi:ElaB/YqjD/DUF883 family membrane-anchored ribosome-binding protein
MATGDVRIPVRDTCTVGGPQAAEHSCQEASSSLIDKAKEAATAVIEKTRGAASTLVEKTEELASGVAGKTSEFAGTIGRKTSEAARSAVEGVEAGAEYVRREGVSGMARDVGEVIARHPWPSLAIGFALGFLLAKLRRD